MRSVKIMVLISGLLFFKWAQAQQSGDVCDNLSSGAAADIQVCSHFPQSAFVPHRLLPFQLVGDGTLKVERVEITSGASCSGFPDPYHADHFHIYCEDKENQITLRIHYDNSSRGSDILQVSPLVVQSLSAASPVPINSQDEASQ